MLKCLLSPVAHPVKSLVRRIKKSAKTRPASSSHDIFVNGRSPESPKPSQQHVFLVSDPFTRRMESVTTKPVRDLDAIFNEGWAKLATANTVETKRQALNGIMYGISTNCESDCIGISRAIVERLSTGRQAHLKDYAHLNSTLRHTWDANDTEKGLFSARPDKVAKLSATDWSNASEAEVFNRINCRYGTLRARAGKEFDALKNSFLEDYSINKQGIQKAQSLHEIESTIQKAGDGAIGYIFPDSHILPVVNVKGDVFALPNFWDSPPCAKHMSGSVTDTLGVSPPQHLKYVITTHRLLRPRFSSVA